VFLNGSLNEKTKVYAIGNIKKINAKTT